MHPAAGQEVGPLLVQPAHELPGRGLKLGLHAVFRLQPVLRHLELQRPHGRQQRGGGGRVLNGKLLHDAFEDKLLEPRPERLEFGRHRIVEVGKTFRRETRDLVENHGGVLGQRVAYLEFLVPDKAHDIARPGLVHRLPLLAEKLVGIRKPHFFPRA